MSAALFASIGVAITIFGSIPYLVQIFRKKAKPHFYSWFLWFFLMVVAIAGQLKDGEDVGSWVLIVSTSYVFIIMLLSIFYGEKNITKIDRFCLFTAFFIIPFWFWVKSPELALTLAMIIDCIALLPTLRKSIQKPHEEVIVFFFLNAIKYSLALAAIESWTYLTSAFLIMLVVQNTFITVFLLTRRWQLREIKT